MTIMPINKDYSNDGDDAGDDGYDDQFASDLKVTFHFSLVCVLR